MLLGDGNQLVHHPAHKMVTHDRWQRVIIALRHHEVVQLVMASAWGVDAKHHDRSSDLRTMSCATMDSQRRATRYRAHVWNLRAPFCAKRGQTSSGGTSHVSKCA